MTYQPTQQLLAEGGVVILDGAIGTEILRRNVTWADHQVTRLPEVIRGIHEDYVRAGADVVTTNTFQLMRRSFLNHFKDLEHMRRIGAPDLEERAGRMLRAATVLAQEARRRAASKRPVAIAGAVTTLEWCFRPDLAPKPDQAEAEYLEAMRALKEAGSDLILLETINSIDEAVAGLSAANSVGLPCWVSFVCDQGGRLFTGERLQQAVERLAPLGPAAVLLNCAPPDDVSAGLEELVRFAHAQIPVGAYPHVGRFDPPEWLFTDEYPPLKYLEWAQSWARRGVQILGGCCGTTPDHIAALAEGLRVGG